MNSETPGNEPPEKTKRANSLTLRQRVEEVLQMRLAGLEFMDIRQHAEKEGWNVSERQLWRYIAAGDKLLEESLEKDRLKVFNRAIAQRRALLARSMSVSDYSTAARILKDEAELLNLYPPKRTEMSGPNGGPISTATVELTEDERAAAITALFARVGQGDPRPSADQSSDGPGSALGRARSSDEGGSDDAGPLATDVTPLNL
jgi:hypothetical protein